MSEEDDIHDRLNDRINVRSFFERILKERERLEEERQERIDERFRALDKALRLQAQEYERRLHDLNGEYQRDRQRQSDYVTVDKWEQTNKAESTARAAALLRVDEKFEEYVKRYEVRQREIDLLLSAQKGAAEAAIRAAEDQGRRSNRNIGVAGVVLGLIVLVVNIIPQVVK
jgi:hypothetical protein